MDVTTLEQASADEAVSSGYQPHVPEACSQRAVTRINFRFGSVPSSNFYFLSSPQFYSALTQVLQITRMLYRMRDTSWPPQNPFQFIYPQISSCLHKGSPLQLRAGKHVGGSDVTSMRLLHPLAVESGAGILADATGCKISLQAGFSCLLAAGHIPVVQGGRLHNSSGHGSRSKTPQMLIR